MTGLELFEPRSIPEATSLLAQYGDDGRMMAGGSAHVLMLKNRIIAPSALISLGGLDELRYMREDQDGTLRIGSLITPSGCCTSCPTSTSIGLLRSSES